MEDLKPYYAISAGREKAFREGTLEKSRLACVGRGFGDSVPDAFGGNSWDRLMQDGGDGGDRAIWAMKIEGAVLRRKLIGFP